MRTSRFTTEQVVAIERESNAHGVSTDSKKHYSEHTMYLGRRKYGEMDAAQVSEL